ncbi:MAG: PaaI family thioesterase [Pseudonocardiaceae bacterium]|nr:PaaI family thioesterase [Pseudonocardiaceae bacterium]
MVRSVGASSESDATGPRVRRRAVVELAESLRELLDAAVSTTAPAPVLRAVAARVRDVVAQLSADRRGRFEAPDVDEAGRGARFYNPVAGPGNPMAPPLRTRTDGDVVIGTCTLGLGYEGPRSWAHGGVSAMLLDHVLGHANFASTGRAGLTVSLSLRYRSPVPLQTPLRLTGRVVADEDGKVTTAGAIATEAEPETALVEAEGVFVSPRPDQARRLYGADAPGAESARD